MATPAHPVQAERRGWYPHLRQSLHHSGQGFGQVVVDNHYCEQHQKHECGLVDALFNLQADIAAHQAFDEQQQDYPAVEDGNW